MYDQSVFRRYDIRGKADIQVTEPLAEGVGRVLGDRIRERGGTSAAVGKDVRHSSPRLAAAVVRGLLSRGLHVLDFGELATPMLYHALYARSLGGGVMVTGSHNPRGDNGLKLCLGTDSVYGDGITSLREDMLRPPSPDRNGRSGTEDYRADYFSDLLPRFESLRSAKLRVAVDCGNGVMGPIVLDAFHRLGVEVDPLYCDPDGDFPNHIPDPEVPEYMEALGRRVVEGSCAVGLGFDGDGDRVGILTESGEKISADWLVALFARHLLPSHPGGRVRFDVKCSDFLAEDILAHGGVPVMGETGHSLLKRDVKRDDCILGGELSGHIVFNRGYYPIDDALYCALRFLQIMQESGGPASALFQDFPRWHTTAEIKLPCADDRKFDVVRALQGHFAAGFEVCDLDGARVRTEDGWFLVRASNTTPNLTVRFEAKSAAGLDRDRRRLDAALLAHPVDRAPLRPRSGPK